MWAYHKSKEGVRWWGPRGMRNTHLWDSENSVINRATAASRVHLLAASNASREPWCIYLMVMTSIYLLKKSRS